MISWHCIESYDNVMDYTIRTRIAYAMLRCLSNVTANTVIMNVHIYIFCVWKYASNIFLTLKNKILYDINWLMLFYYHGIKY